MIRQNIILGESTYILDLYDAFDDLKNTPHHEKFVMLRNGNVMNNVFRDTDILFIQQSLIEAYKDENNMIDIEKLTSNIVFPFQSRNKVISYSNNFKYFNKNIVSLSNLYSNLEKIYNEDKTETSILCDKLRIWFPINRQELSSIIDIEVYVNDIHIHLLCKKSDSLDINSNNEIICNNKKYSEYIETYIPNCYELFASDKFYFIDYNNIGGINKMSSFDNIEEEGLERYKENINIYKRSYPSFENNQQILELKNSLLIIANNARTANKYNISIYDGETEEDYYFSNLCCNITGIDFSGKSIRVKNSQDETVYEENISSNELFIDENSNIYYSLSLICAPYYIEETPEFSIVEYDTSLYGTTHHANEKVYKVNENKLNSMNFNIKVTLYPINKYDEENERYIGYEDIEPNVDVFSHEKHIVMKNSYKFSLEEDSKGALIISSVFDFPKNYDSLVEAYLGLNNESNEYNYSINEEDYENELIPEEIKKSGFKIEISNEKHFKNPVYYDFINIEDHIIDNLDYVLSMDNLKASWKSYPDILFIRVTFFDRCLANVINGNDLIITKEEFKYIVNSNNRRIKLYEKQLELMDPTYFNFIDKINCTVIKQDDEEQAVISNSKTNSKIIYKPIFYKIKDLEQIKIKSGITQNIGINLASIISKINTFKMIINGKEYIEIGRNDIYVIFKINASELTDKAGQYILMNQDNEYISDGNWYTY